jgi:uncharacterized protein YjbI with pentapeptide repeats
VPFLISGANLVGAQLTWADLRGANLEGAVLRGARLIRTNLRLDRGVTGEQLEEAKVHYDTIMPKGQKYGDWLKSKGGREDGENISSQ